MWVSEALPSSPRKEFSVPWIQRGLVGEPHRRGGLGHHLGIHSRCLPVGPSGRGSREATSPHFVVLVLCGADGTLLVAGFWPCIFRSSPTLTQSPIFSHDPLILFFRKKSSKLWTKCVQNCQRPYLKSAKR